MTSNWIKGQGHQHPGCYLNTCTFQHMITGRYNSNKKSSITSFTKPEINNENKFLKKSNDSLLNTKKFSVYNAH